MIDFPDGVNRLQECWQNKLAQAQSHYRQNRTDESKKEVLRVLRTFTDLVVHHQLPDED